MIDEFRLRRFFQWRQAAVALRLPQMVQRRIAGDVEHPGLETAPLPETSGLA